MRLRHSPILVALAVIDHGAARQLAVLPGVPTPAGQVGACATDFERLVRKVEQNYAGYVLEVTPATRSAYERHRERLRASAVHATGEACYFVLRDFVAFFRDPHLFIFQSTRLDTAESTRRARAVGLTQIDEAQARAYYRRNARRLDPIEGIWYEPGLRVAVVRAPGGPGAAFHAVVLTSDTSVWSPGAIRARFTRRADRGYDADLWSRNHALRHLDARVHKRVLLRLSPGMWGKEFPVAPADSGLLDPTDPHRPTLMARDGAMVVSLPSHDPSFKSRLDSLVQEHAAALAAAARVIIDLRGNEGGAAFMTRALMPFIASDSQRASPLGEGEAVMLSSDDQITYVQRFLVANGDTTPSVQRLLARLRANPGRLVPLEDSLDSPGTERDSVVPGRRLIGILVDGGTVSAAEAFLARAMRSTRVTVFGEPTAGALDYQSVFIVPFQETGRRWLLGYPTIAARASLPARGIRGRGIPPQIPIDWDRERDPIARVDHELTKRRE